jgi:hypothetical protein
MLFNFVDDTLGRIDMTAVADNQGVPRDATNALGRIAPRQPTSQLNFLRGMLVRSRSADF